MPDESSAIRAWECSLLLSAKNSSNKERRKKLKKLLTNRKRHDKIKKLSLRCENKTKNLDN